MARFSDHVVVVTGGSRGIGLAIVHAFAREEAQVIIAAKDAERGAAVGRVLSDSGARVEFLRTDVTQ